MIKVFLITQNEPFYIPKMIRYLIENQGEEYIISGYTVLSPTRKNKSIIHWFSERAKIYSIWELVLIGIAFVFVKTVGLFNLSTNYNNRALFTKAKIKEIKSNDINSNVYINQLKADTPDVILSISCPQLFEEDLLKVAKLHCINAHGTLLPRHRGVFGGFWTLFDDDTLAGGTIHTMELKLDAGEIIWQESFPIQKSDTQYSIAYKTKKIMAKGLVKSFTSLNKNKKVKTISSEYSSSYHRSPSREQGLELKKLGKRIVRLSDLKYMLSKFY